MVPHENSSGVFRLVKGDSPLEWNLSSPATFTSIFTSVSKANGVMKDVWVEDMELFLDYGMDYIRDPEALKSSIQKRLDDATPVASKVSDESPSEEKQDLSFHPMVETIEDTTYLFLVPKSYLDKHFAVVQVIPFSPAQKSGALAFGSLQSKPPPWEKLNNKIGNAASWSLINWSNCPSDSAELDKLVERYTSYANGSSKKLATVAKWKSLATQHIKYCADNWNKIATRPSERHEKFCELLSNNKFS